MKSKPYIEAIKKAHGSNVYKNFMRYLKRHSPEPVTPDLNRFFRRCWFLGGSQFQELWAMDIDIPQPAVRLAKLAFTYTDKLEYADALVEVWCIKHGMELSDRKVAGVLRLAWSATAHKRAAFEAKQKKQSMAKRRKPSKPVKGYEAIESGAADSFMAPKTGKSQPTRAVIADYLGKHPQGKTPLEIAQSTRLSRSNVRQTLRRMLSGGEVAKVGDVYSQAQP